MLEQGGGQELGRKTDKCEVTSVPSHLELTWRSRTGLNTVGESMLGVDRSQWWCGRGESQEGQEKLWEQKGGDPLRWMQGQ